MMSPVLTVVLRLVISASIEEDRSECQQGVLQASAALARRQQHQTIRCQALLDYGPHLLGGVSG